MSEQLASARRVLRVFKALRGATFTGFSNKDLVKSLGETPSNISRALTALADEGLAVRLDNGRYAHSVAALQIAEAYRNDMERLRARMTEVEQRVAAGSIND